MENIPDAQEISSSRIDRLIEWCELLWPWLILPLAIVYLIDLSILLFELVKIFIALAILVNGLGFFAGVGLALFKPSYKTYILNLRLTKYLPTVSWAHGWTDWLLQEDTDGH